MEKSTFYNSVDRLKIYGTFQVSQKMGSSHLYSTGRPRRDEKSFPAM